MSEAVTITLDQQIACAAREIAMREAVYPKWVDAKKMLPAKADFEISAMKAILATLKKLKENPNV